MASIKGVFFSFSFYYFLSPLVTFLPEGVVLGLHRVVTHKNIRFGAHTKIRAKKLKVLRIALQSFSLPLSA